MPHASSQIHAREHKLDPRLNHNRPSTKIGAWTPRLIQRFSLLLMI